MTALQPLFNLLTMKDECLYLFLNPSSMMRNCNSLALEIILKYSLIFPAFIKDLAKSFNELYCDIRTSILFSFLFEKSKTNGVPKIKQTINLSFVVR